MKTRSFIFCFDRETPIQVLIFLLLSVDSTISIVFVEVLIPSEEIRLQKLLSMFFERVVLLLQLHQVTSQQAFRHQRKLGAIITPQPSSGPRPGRKICDWVDQGHDIEFNHLVTFIENQLGQ